MRPGSTVRSDFGVRGLPLTALLALATWGCETTVTEVIVPPDVPPAAPQGLYSVTGDQRVTLYWIHNTEPDFAEYCVWRGPAYEGPYELLGHTTQTSWADETAENAVTYFFAVSALDHAGLESPLSKESVFDTPRPEGFALVLTNSDLGADKPAGYDFSAGAVRRADDPRTDVYFFARSGLQLLIARDVDTDVQDAGYRALEDLDWAPGDGWSPTGEAELIAGHSYYVWTRDNHYAKVECVSVDGAQAVLNWAYQLMPGNPELKPHPRSSPGSG
jgi:hypothetical protein